MENFCWREDTEELIRELFPHTGGSFVLGVTGSPGAGKSTLVDQLTRSYREDGKSVGILAFDPSSPFSGGALLGDRIRMQGLACDSGVFIRSMATRGQMGGLSPSVLEALIVLDAAGYQVLIVETVGVGQDEVDIVRMADSCLVVLVPGMGDDVQTLKAGLMEIGDIFVINKADRDDAGQTEQELQALLSLGGRPDGWEPLIQQTVATRATGIPELVDAIGKYRQFLQTTDAREQRKLRIYQDRLLNLLQDRLRQMILERIPESQLESWAQQMMNRRLDPYTIVRKILVEAGLEETK